LKPKCLREAHLPKHWLASDSLRTLRNTQDEDKGNPEKCLTQSLFLCIAVPFPIRNSLSTNSSGYPHRQLAGRETLQGAPAQGEILPNDQISSFIGLPKAELPSI
jgi:hypothetical protein